MPPKETVVILAESPLHYRGTTERSQTFIQHAEDWRDENPGYNVVIVPYYNPSNTSETSTKDNLPELYNAIGFKNAKKEIDKIDGNFSIFVMGHAGEIMGGYPLTETIRLEQIERKVNWTAQWKEELQNDIELLQSNPNRTTGSGYSNISQVEERWEDLVNHRKDSIGRLVSDKGNTLADFLEINYKGRINSMIFGACSMGERCSMGLQELATDLGIPVSGQWKANWGMGHVKDVTPELPTDTVESTAFVAGRDAHGAMYLPGKNVPIPILRTGETGNEKRYDDLKRQIKSGWRFEYADTIKRLQYQEELEQSIEDSIGILDQKLSITEEDKIMDTWESWKSRTPISIGQER